MTTKIGLVMRLGRLITIPEQVDKLEKRVEHVIEKVDDVKTDLSTCVTRDELTETLAIHREVQSEKLDLVIDLLKKNNKK